MRTPQTPVLELHGESVPLGALVRDIIRHRDITWMLANRDFRARYRSSNLGLIWSVLLPFVQGSILAVVFTRVVRIHTGVNYPIYVLLGTTLWGYFSASFTGASTAIVGQSSITGRLYFPRILVTGAPVLSGLPSYLLSTVVLLVLMPFFDVDYHWQLIGLPLAVLLSMALAIALGASIAILHVYVRDVAYAITAGMQVWYYATPVIYPLTLAHEFQGWLIANPMTGILQLAHWSVFADSQGSLSAPLISTCAWILGLKVLALLVYKRFERVACDRL